MERECFVFDNRVSLKHGLKLEPIQFVVGVENPYLKRIQNLKNMN